MEAGDLPLGVVSAPANRHDPPPPAPTSDLIKDLGPLPETIRVHLDAGYDSTSRRFCWPGGDSKASSHTKGCPHRPRPPNAGRWNAPRPAQHLLQARPMHRTPADRRRLLHRLRQHRRPGLQTPTPGLDPLPLGDPTQPTALTCWAHCLRCHAAACWVCWFQGWPLRRGWAFWGSRAGCEALSYALT